MSTGGRPSPGPFHPAIRGGTVAVAGVVLVAFLAFQLVLHVVLKLLLLAAVVVVFVYLTRVASKPRGPGPGAADGEGEIR